MRSSTNNSGQSETLDLLYEVLLYKKKDIIAIQKKLGISSNANQTAMHQSKKAKTLADLYKLLLDLVEDMTSIQKGLGIIGNPILEEALQSNKAPEASTVIEIHNLLLCLEENIIAIQEELGIIGYSNQERAEEANENARAYLQKFEKFHGPLEDDPGVVLEKYGKMTVKKIRFTEEGFC
ncbi:40815_t:CDS:1 [Gigaspora margarita]|uniref:40815_t:CDS:1 n=1 Tax=Gigaspora margarita TaxID=4874 RepID=A0ABN7VGE3_GIGMA|nr:40815_t:CDS:1 [Gigaspora margarita]